MALMLLFPPWDYFDSDTSGRQPAGYHLFLMPPEPRPVKDVFGPPRYPHMTKVRVDDFRLTLQLLITVPTVAGLAILFRSKRSVILALLGILFLLGAGFVVGFEVWVMVSERLEYGHWSLP